MSGLPDYFQALIQCKFLLDFKRRVAADSAIALSRSSFLDSLNKVICAHSLRPQMRHLPDASFTTLDLPPDVSSLCTSSICTWKSHPATCTVFFCSAGHLLPHVFLVANH